MAIKVESLIEWLQTQKSGSYIGIDGEWLFNMDAPKDADEWDVNINIAEGNYPGSEPE